jgi:RND family efflux transporter MFP subunit
MSLHRIRVGLAVGGSVLVAALVLGAGRSSDTGAPGGAHAAAPAPAGAESRPARTVAVLTPDVAAAGETIVLPGRVRAREEAVLTATVGGRLTSLAGEGESFRRGDRLASFDATEMRQALASAEAAVQSAAVQADVARRQAARVDSLFDRGVVSRRQEEEARAAREMAEAEEAGARARRAQLDEGARVAAPFDGVVVRRLLDPGSTVAPGTPLLSIRSATAGEVEAAVPESQLDALAGARLDVQVGDADWRPARLVRAEGMTDPATRTRLVRVALDDDASLSAGAFARLRVTPEPATTVVAAGDDIVAPGGAAPRLHVPESSLVRRGALVGVFLEESGAARLTWLRIGRRTGDRVEVLAGLSESDRVIAEPAGLSDGHPVTVR